MRDIADLMTTMRAYCAGGMDDPQWQELCNDLENILQHSARREQEYGAQIQALKQRLEALLGYGARLTIHDLARGALTQARRGRS
jgi:hypothetical protein